MILPLVYLFGKMYKKLFFHVNNKHNVSFRIHILYTLNSSGSLPSIETEDANQTNQQHINQLANNKANKQKQQPKQTTLKHITSLKNAENPTKKDQTSIENQNPKRRKTKNQHPANNKHHQLPPPKKKKKNKEKKRKNNKPKKRSTPTLVVSNGRSSAWSWVSMARFAPHSCKRKKPPLGWGTRRLGLEEVSFLFSKKKEPTRRRKGKPTKKEEHIKK